MYLKENVVFLLNYLNKTFDKPNIEENPIMKLTSLLDDLFQINLTSDKKLNLSIGPSGHKKFLAQKFHSKAKTITLN